MRSLINNISDAWFTGFIFAIILIIVAKYELTGLYDELFCKAQTKNKDAFNQSFNI